MMFSYRHSFIIAAFLLTAVLSGCSKDDASAGAEPVDRSRIGYVIEDNFNYTACRSVLEFTRQMDRLRSDTSYTLLAPDNVAFELLRITGAPHYAFADAWFGDVAGNMVLPGVHSLRALPLGDNQPLPTLSGNKVYVSRYMSNNDTITRVNGIKVSVIDIKAGNGLMQSMSEVVQPETRNNVVSMLHSDTSFTLFAQALQHAGLLNTLKNGEYTLLAPHNEVLRGLGNILPGIDLSSSVKILEADPAALADLMKYHILPGKMFLDGIHRRADTSGDASVVTLNGAKLIIGGSIDSYLSTSFLGNLSSGPAGIYRFWSQQNNMANLPAGNGVVHAINKVLIP